MRKILKTAFIIPFLTSTAFAVPVGQGDIKKATAQCEREVPQHCMQVTCPLFCEASLKNRRNKEPLITKCKEECTLQKRCLLKPVAGNDDPQNRELDAQNRDQLFACVAEVRDPEGKKSGRRMTPWRDLTTPSWEKLMGMR